MNEDERIEYLNHSIIDLNQRITRIRIRDDVIGISLGLMIVFGINIYAFSKLEDYYNYRAYSTILLLSIGLGIAPGINLPTYKTMKKISKYQMQIKNYMNELHEIALEENQKIYTKRIGK